MTNTTTNSTTARRSAIGTAAVLLAASLTLGGAAGAQAAGAEAAGADPVQNPPRACPLDYRPVVSDSTGKTYANLCVGQQAEGDEVTFTPRG